MVIDRLFTLRDQAERLRMELGKLIENEHPHYRAKLREEYTGLPSVSTLKTTVDIKVTEIS